MGPVLVINAGSSSIKLAVFTPALVLVLAASVTRIGGDACLTIGGEARPVVAGDHRAALGVLLAALAQRGTGVADLAAVGHRVVHGGENLIAPCRITAATIAEIRACARLAPLHNPHNLAAIEALAALAPALPQCASFDTAFHATNPDVATRFALPDVPAAQGLRRYGFHGLSYASLIRALPRQSAQPLPRRLLAYHLGNGASACAIVNGHSLCTTMGYSPLDGLTMGTRVGSIDPEAVLTLAERIGIAATRALLTHEAGLRGLSGGVSDMQVLLNDHSEKARGAVDHFCHWAIRHGGGLIAAMGGVDAVAFTGGIGEHAAPVRNRIAAGLAFAGAKVWVVPAEEEHQIARDTAGLIAQGRMN